MLEEPCVFAVENGHFIDNESWSFLEDLVSDSHAVLVMTIKPLNTLSKFPESAKRLIAGSQTVKMTLGMKRLRRTKYFSLHLLVWVSMFFRVPTTHLNY